MPTSIGLSSSIQLRPTTVHNRESQHSQPTGVSHNDISIGPLILRRKTFKIKPSNLEAQRRAGPPSHDSDPPTHTQSTTSSVPTAATVDPKSPATLPPQRISPLPLQPGDRYPTMSLTPADTPEVDEARRRFGCDNNTVVGSGSRKAGFWIRKSRLVVSAMVWDVRGLR